MNMTRAQILKEYDLRPKDLDVLLGSGLLSGKFESKDGRLLLDVSDSDVFVLESARNSVSSFGYGSVNSSKVRGVHTLPFHRFLVLRFLNTPIEEIYDEIFQLDLLHSRKKFTIQSLKAIHKRFISRVPESLRETLEKQAPPTDENRDDFLLFLRVLNIRKFYEEPEIMEQLRFFMESKSQVEMYMSTNSTADEIAEILSTQLSTTIASLGVWSYRILFYAIHEITAEDMEAYFLCIRPQEKRMKKVSIPRTIKQLVVSLGITEVSNTRDVLDHVKRVSQKDYCYQEGLKTTNALQVRKFALDQYMKADEYIESHGGNIADFSRLFNKFVIKKVPTKIVSIEDIRGSQRESGTE